MHFARSVTAGPRFAGQRTVIRASGRLLCWRQSSILPSPSLTYPLVPPVAMSPVPPSPCLPLHGAEKTPPTPSLASQARSRKLQLLRSLRAVVVAAGIFALALWGAIGFGLFPHKCNPRYPRNPAPSSVPFRWPDVSPPRLEQTRRLTSLGDAHFRPPLAPLLRLSRVRAPASPPRLDQPFGPPHRRGRAYKSPRRRSRDRRVLVRPCTAQPGRPRRLGRPVRNYPRKRDTGCGRTHALRHWL